MAAPANCKRHHVEATPQGAEATWSAALLDDDLRATGDVPPDAGAPGAADLRGDVDVLPGAVLVPRREEVLAGDADPELAGAAGADGIGDAVAAPALGAVARRGLGGRRTHQDGPDDRYAGYGDAGDSSSHRDLGLSSWRLRLERRLSSC